MGCEAAPTLEPTGAATVKSFMLTSSALPEPGGTVKTPGACGAPEMTWGLLISLFTVTTTLMFPLFTQFAKTSKGTCTLTNCDVGATSSTAPGTPLKVTLTPPRAVENGTESASAAVAPGNDPKIVTSAPGAMGGMFPFAPCAKVALLTMP